VQLKADRDSITSDGKDLIFIEADITDAKGVIVPTATNTVNFSISGPGKIVGVDNGNAISLESYKGSSRSAFSGKCLVIVQVVKNYSGLIVVTAGSNGLSSGSATITVTGGPPWPSNPDIPYVRFRNVATGLYIDGMGSTADGSNACQRSDSSSDNQQWAIINSGSYVRIQNRATGLYLDGMGRTSNGSVCGQWGNSGSANQQWTQEALGNYVRFKNRATGLYLDGMGSTGNGSNLCQWSNSGSANQQWQIQ
jgi:hypothetical protein